MVVVDGLTLVEVVVVPLVVVEVVTLAVVVEVVTFAVVVEVVEALLVVDVDVVGAPDAVPEGAVPEASP